MWTNKDFTGLTFGQFPGGLNLGSSAWTSLYGFYIFAAKTFCILCGSIYVSPKLILKIFLNYIYLHKGNPYV